MTAARARVLWALVLAVGIAGLTPAAAGADPTAAEAWAAEYGPAVCDALAYRPTIDTLIAAMDADESVRGVTPEQSWQDVGTAVLRYCPRFRPLLTAFVAAVNPVITVAARTTANP